MVADFESICVYWGALLLSLLQCRSFCVLKKNGCINFIGILITCLPLSIVAGLRNNVGTDWNNYLYAYESINNYTWVNIFTEFHSHEPAFMAMSKIVNILTDSNIFAYYFTSELVTLFFALFGFVRLSKMYKINVPFAFFIFFLSFYHPSLNITRQIISVGILILAFSYLLEKRFKAYICVVLLAFLFHRSAILCMLYPLFYLLLPRDISHKPLLPSSKYIGFSILFTLSLGFIISNFTMLSIVAGRYDSYDIDTGSSVGLGQIFIFIYSIVPVLILGRKSLRADKMLLFLYYIILFYLPISIVGYFADYVSRMNIYGQISFIIMSLILCRAGTNGKKICTYITIVYIVTYVSEILIKNFHMTFPYTI